MERIKQIPSSEKRITRRGFLRKLIGLSGKGEDVSLADTARLATAFTLGIAATAPAATKLEELANIKFGNSAMYNPEGLKTLRKNPAVTFLLGTVVAPVLEEVPFRILPSLASPTSWGNAWKVGIVSSTVFAGAHGVDTEETTQQIKFSSVPIYHFGGGLLLWNLTRTRGYLHAILAHSVINAISLTSFFLEPGNQTPENNNSQLQKN